jgi:hypothetical protein
LSSPLQKGPAGLLSFLELKTNGESPKLFGGELTPVIDVAEFYSATDQLVGVAAGNVTNQGDAITATVPAGFMWRLRAVSFLLVSPAAGAAVDGLGASVYYDPGTGGVVLCNGRAPPKVTAAAAYSCTGAANFGRPILALPDSRILLVNDCTMGAAAAASIRLLFDLVQYP